MLRFLCEAGGISHAEACDTAEERRYATLGGLALLTGLMAALSCAATATTQLHLPWYVSAGMGLLVGLMVWGIDRMFVLTPMLQDGTWYRIRMLLTRGAISLVLGLFISHGLVVFAFNQDLQARVDIAAVQAADAAEASVRKNDKNKEQINALKRENTRLQGEIDSQQKKSDAKRKAWKDSTACVGSGGRAADGDYCGEGGVSPGLKKDWQEYRDNTLANTKAANAEQIAKNNATASQLRAALETKVAKARDAAMKNVGVAAKTDALFDLIKQDPFLLFLPLLFIVLDLAVVLSKALFPRSKLDMRAQAEREDFVTMRAGMTSSAEFSNAYKELATIEAQRMVRDALLRDEVATARAERSKERALARINRTDGPRRARRWVAAGTAAVVLIAGAVVVVRHASDKSVAGPVQSPTAGAVTPSPTPSGDGKQRVAAASDTDRSLDLGDGVVLRIPVGAISNNAEVTATPAVAGTKPGRDGFVAVTPAYEIKTAGKIVGKGTKAPHLSLSVSKRVRELAEAGALTVAFHTDDGWKTATGKYDQATGKFSVAMPHFSWWEFWTWDWAKWGAEASQAVLSKIGMRSNKIPECKSKTKAPSWFAQAPGIADGAGLVIRSCSQGDGNDPNVLSVQLVNNRPVGMILNFNGAEVTAAGHQDPETLPEAIQYALGDAAADAAGGLYLPPLGRAWIGIRNPGAGTSHDYFIGPSFATLGGDILQALADGAIPAVADAATARAVYRIYRDTFKAAMSGKCSGLAVKATGSMVSGQGPADKENWLSLMNDLLGGDLAACVAAATTAIAREGVANGKDITSVVSKFSSVVQFAKAAAKAGKLFSVAKVIANVGDIWVDSFAAAGKQGYGFSVWARSTPVPDSSPSDAETLKPKPTRTAETSRGPVSTPVRPARSHEPTPPTTPTLASQPVTLYDNYGEAAGPGTPMCAGNPGRPESMPGGRLVQRFTAQQSSTITRATVQIDPAPAISVTATISVNGVSRASATATPTGDTRFGFASVPVRRGDIVDLSLNWSTVASPDNNPKLDTIYTTGTPGGSLTVTNTCSDGAPTYSTSAAGLRARIEGTG